jgi:tetratricopeptide (TPR) repeat protein
LFENFGKKQAAIDDYTKAIELYKAHPPGAADETARFNGLMLLANAFNRRGALWSESNQFSKAAADFSESIKQIEILNSPSTFKVLKSAAFSLAPSPYAGRAAAYEKLGKHDLAQADQKKLEELKKADAKKFTTRR